MPREVKFSSLVIVVCTTIGAAIAASAGLIGSLAALATNVIVAMSLIITLRGEWPETWAEIKGPLTEF